MNILYISDCAGSRIHGMAYRKYQFSKEFVKRGHKVKLVAASFCHARRVNPTVNKSVTTENIDGIEYNWLKTPKYEENGIRRIFQMITFNLRLYFNYKKIIKDFVPDIIIVGGITPVDFYVSHKIAKKTKSKTIYEVGDLWPLSPIELGGYSLSHPFIQIMQKAENYAYKNTDAVVSLLPCAEPYMRKHGLKENKFYNIPNGVILEDWKAFNELPQEHTELIKKLKFENKFLIGYAGAHGMANSLTSVIDAVACLYKKDIVLLLIGTGLEKDNLITYAKKHNVSNVYFLPAITKNQIPTFLQKMDILYIGLKKQSLFRLGISPNKLFDYMMASKPIIQAIDAGNNIVKDANCGLYAEPENPEAIADAIINLKNISQEERDQLGKNGKEYVIKYHSYNVLTTRYLSIMENLTNASK